MKGVLIFIFVFCAITKEALFSPKSNVCEGDEYNGNWTCVRNDDNTVNITFDCNINGIKEIQLGVRSHEYPKRIRSLKIQNCQNLTLDISCKADNTSQEDEADPIMEWSHLQIANITTLHVKENSLSRAPENSYYFTRHDPIFLGRYHPGPLRSVIFENISVAMFKAGLDFPSGIKCDQFTRLKSLKIINVNIVDHFEGFSSNLKELKEFTMDNVNVTFRTVFYLYRQINIRDEDAVVKIINSTFTFANKIFDGKVSKVIVMESKFYSLPTEGFSFEADEFVFSGNLILRLATSALAVKASAAHIYGNTFHQVDTDAFNNIRPRDIQRTQEIKGIYNFSNNELHVLESGALSLPPISSNSYFNTIIIFNNSINCSCQNFQWFESFTDGRHLKSHLYSLWLKNNNQNKCLNVQTCTLRQAMFNFFEFCEDDYKCPVNVSNVDMSSNLFVHLEEMTKHSFESDQKLVDFTSKILQILTKENTSFDHLESLFKIMILLFLVFLFLISVILCHFILLKFFNVNCLNFRFKRLKSMDSEMNSQVSLTS